MVAEAVIAMAIVIVRDMNSVYGDDGSSGVGGDFYIPRVQISQSTMPKAHLNKKILIVNVENIHSTHVCCSRWCIQ